VPQNLEEDALPIEWKAFADLTVSELYAVLRLRQQVFVVEQRCAYLDADGLDSHSWHALARNSAGELDATARILPAGLAFQEVSIGRVVSATQSRRLGLGKRVFASAVEQVGVLFATQPIRIGAQRYLVQFYRGFGFEVDSAPYFEDGIEHVEMLKAVG
jgi:ElaA protein